jgi:parvulin-like peptidyl-prolyl isomerase
MFQFLRSRAKMFYWVIAGSFVLFGFFMYAGNDAGCRSKQSGAGGAGIVGTVDGTPLSAQTFDQSVRQQVAAMRQQAPERELNANQYAMAQERAWESLVQDALIEKAIKERKIKVSDQEVLDVLTTNPPAEILGPYRDQNGQLDLNRYYADLQNPENDWSQIENYVRQTLLPRQKLTEQIAGGAVVSDEDVRRDYLRQTGLAMAEYFGIAFTDITDGYNPTEPEISAWYAAHPDDYRHDGLAVCKVVRFAKAASSADEKDVLDSLAEVRQDILSGKLDFATAARQFSDDTGSGSRGGDLGTIDRNRMVPEFTKAAFSLPVGQISEPVRTKFGYHLIEVVAQQTGAGGEVTQITARHILQKVTPGPQTLDLISEAANGFRSRVNAGSFTSTAEAEAHELLAPAPVARGRDIPGLAMSIMGTNWLFAAKPGTISPVFENDDCYYLLSAERVDPAGLRTLDEVRSQVMLAVRKQHNGQVARQRLAPAIAAIKAGAAMSQAAGDFGLKYAVTDSFSYNSNVADVGYGTDFNKEIIEGLVGRPTAEIETARGVYVGKPLWIKPIDETDFAVRRAGIQQALLARAQGEIVEKWLLELKNQAKIEDRRALRLGDS